MDQLDYRANPSLGQLPTDPPQDHIDRDHPTPAPEAFVSPGNDEEIVNYDLPHEPHTYNQMSMGLPAPEQGWSSDSYRQMTPDVHPRGH